MSDIHCECLESQTECRRIQGDSVVSMNIFGIFNMGISKVLLWPWVAPSEHKITSRRSEGDSQKLLAFLDPTKGIKGICSMAEHARPLGNTGIVGIPLPLTWTIDGQCDFRGLYPDRHLKWTTHHSPQILGETGSHKENCKAQVSTQFCWFSFHHFPRHYGRQCNIQSK